MRFIYSQWDESLAARLKAMKNLMAIFNHILLQVNGDVEIALQVMEKLRQMGYLPPGADLEEFKKQLQDHKYVTMTESGPKLTTRGEKGLRHDAFEKIFEQLRLANNGQHILPHEGGSSDEVQPERRRFRFGDDLRRIDFQSSLLNSVVRSGSMSPDLREDDLEVFDTDKSTTCATALLIDISHSMILYGEDRITPAKQVALAFTELIQTRFPKDSLHVVLFGDFAAEIPVKDLPYIGVGPYHTNTKAGLQMARKILLRQKSANRQIFMVTDGKPSMITRRDGSVFRNPFGLDPVVVNRTLDEAIICRRKRIPITTFMIAEDPYLRKFVEKLTELNKGRAYFASPDNLGDYVFWDFLKHRRKDRP